MATPSGLSWLGLDPGTHIPANSRAPCEEDTRFLLGSQPLLSWEQMSLLPAHACELGWHLLLLSEKQEPWMEISGLPQRGKLSLPWLLPLPSCWAPNPGHPLLVHKHFWALPEPCFPLGGCRLGCFHWDDSPTVLRKGAGGVHERDCCCHMEVPLRILF